MCLKRVVDAAPPSDEAATRGLRGEAGDVWVLRLRPPHDPSRSKLASSRPRPLLENSSARQPQTLKPRGFRASRPALGDARRVGWALVPLDHQP
jgi:hypothetical protein